MNGDLYVLEKDGSLHRKFSNVHESSPAIGSNGTVYVTDGYYLYALADSSRMWKSDNYSNIQTSPVIGSDGTIYIGPQTRPVVTEAGPRKSFSETDPVYYYAIGEQVDSDVSDIKEDIPTHYSLSQNFPNPFNPSTNIRFSMPQAEQVSITVYNSIGQKVETLINRQMSAGSHSVTFEASVLPSGVYIYQLKTNGFSQSRKMLLVI